MQLMMADCFLETPKISEKQHMIFSNTAMMVDSAAKNRNRKKKLPKIRPPFIEVKMCGSVIKISFGPLSGCTL